ncbi:MAG: hypothetical protein AB7F50_02535 [Fimbriimonadaceae bacterium]
MAVQDRRILRTASGPALACAALGTVIGVALAYGEPTWQAWRRSLWSRDVVPALSPAIEESIGNSFVRSNLSALAGSHLGKRAFGILYMANCNSCKLDADDLDPDRIRKDLPVVYVTTDESVAKYYGQKFLVDKARQVLPSHWYLGGNHFFEFDEAGMLVSVSNGTQESRLAVQGVGE